jgi:hypothetical protein
MVQSEVQQQVILGIVTAPLRTSSTCSSGSGDPFCVFASTRTLAPMPVRFDLTPMAFTLIHDRFHCESQRNSCGNEFTQFTITSMPLSLS